MGSRVGGLPYNYVVVAAAQKALSLEVLNYKYRRDCLESARSPSDSADMEAHHQLSSPNFHYLNSTTDCYRLEEMPEVLEHCSREVLNGLNLSAHMLGICASGDGPEVGVGKLGDWRPRTFEP